MSGDRIEILATDLLDDERAVVESLKALARKLDIGLGWHYLLDLAWIVTELGALGRAQAGLRILDAGAGLGLLQWYLAETGAEVVSVDRSPRMLLAPHLRRHYRIRGLRAQDMPAAGAVLSRALRARHPPRAYLAAALRAVRLLLRDLASPPAPGSVVMYHHDLTTLPDIADESVDAVVAVSALEHNDPAQLPGVVNELVRTLKPGGVLLATLGAARDADWFHVPSQGWNYTDVSLRRVFQLPPEAPSNYERADELFAALRNCAELRDGLAPMYFQSGDNGMPWGKWDPQYQPVAVRKVKQ